MDAALGELSKRDEPMKSVEKSCPWPTQLPAKLMMPAAHSMQYQWSWRRLQWMRCLRAVKEGGDDEGRGEELPTQLPAKLMMPAAHSLQCQPSWRRLL